MSLFRSRVPQAIRRDALHMAARKAEEGCSGCAEAYLEVARQAGAGDEEVDRTRRSMFKRAGLLAGAGLAVSLVDLGGVASGALAAATPQPKLGGWHADYGTAVQSVLDSHAYRRARQHLSGMGVASLEQGSIFFVPASHVPGLERPTYSVVQPFDGGHLQAHVTQDGQSSAVVTVDGRSRFGVHFDGRGVRLGEKQEPFTGRSTGGQLPPGRLLPRPGAIIQQPAASTVPTAGATGTCDVVCILLYGTGCWAFCVFFGPIGAVLCGIVYCGIAGTYVCNQICA